MPRKELGLSDIQEWATHETNLLNIKLQATKKKVKFLEDSIGKERFTAVDLNNKLTLNEAKTRAAKGKVKRMEKKAAIQSYEGHPDSSRSQLQEMQSSS